MEIVEYMSADNQAIESREPIACRTPEVRVRKGRSRLSNGNKLLPGARTAPKAAIASAMTMSILWVCLSLPMRQPLGVSMPTARDMARRICSSG
jgi:hypothetical protein